MGAEAGKMLEALITDFGNVIYKERWDLVERRLKENYTLSISEFQSVFNIFWDDYKIGQLSLVDFWGSVCESLNLESNTKNIMNLSDSFRGIWSDADDKLLDYLRELKQRGIKIFGLTNSCFENEAKIIEDRRKLEFFDRIYMSHQYGIKKPDLSAYKRIINDYNLTPQKCLLVDDKERNTLPANEIGMIVIEYKNLEQLKSKVETLLEVK